MGATATIQFETEKDRDAQAIFERSLQVNKVRFLCWFSNFINLIKLLMLGTCTVHHGFVLLFYFTHIWLHKHSITKDSVSKQTSPHLYIPFLQFQSEKLLIYIAIIIVIDIIIVKDTDIILMMIIPIITVKKNVRSRGPSN